MPHPSPSGRRLAALLIAFVVLVAVAVMTVAGVRRLQASAQLIERTYEVLMAIERAKGDLRAVETNARGYRLTGHSALRRAYFETVPEANEALRELAAATAEDPLQRRRAVEFRAVAQSQLDELARLLHIQDAQGLAAAQAAMQIEASVERAQGARRLGDQMRRHELQLLAQRKADSATRSSMLLAFVTLGITLSLALVALLVRGLARENRRSRELEGEARAAVAALEAASLLGARLSEQRRALAVYSGLLQSCHSREEVMTLTSQTLHGLFPDAGGRCYVGVDADDALQSAACFGDAVIAGPAAMRNEDCWALRRGQPHHTDGGGNGMRCAHLHTAALEAGTSTLCVPLVAQGASLGLLTVNAPSGAIPGTGDIPVVETIAEQLAMALANLRLRDSLRAQSLRDALTGLYNRRHLEATLAHELRRCGQHDQPLSLMMVDVDHFKRFNDEHGHAAGDAVLVEVARTLQSLVRDQDLACRYGGEEFTVVLPEAGRAVALERGEAVRAAVASSTFEHLRKPLGPVTVSIGIATFPADGRDAETLFAVADGALYRAKAKGRNRVEPATAGD